MDKIHFRKTLYFRMILVTLLLGVTFLGALLWIYKVSRGRFEEELTYYSDTLTEQVCQNMDVTLKELSEKTVPLTLTNERFGPLLKDTDSAEETPFLRQRIQNHLEELLSMNYDINWMAVIDGKDRVYMASRESLASDSGPGAREILAMYMENIENLSDRLGNTVWLTSPDRDGILLMRSIFDADTMRFCGSIAAEVKDQPLKDILEHIDSSKVGSFTLYDRNGVPLCSTNPDQDIREMEQSPDHLYTRYPINRGKLTMVHVVDLTEKNQRFSDLLHLISGIGLLVVLVIVLSLWMMFGRMARNLKLLLGNIHRVSEGKFELEPVGSGRGDEIDMLSCHIQEMSARIKTLMEQAVRDKEIHQKNKYQLLEFRYHELQSQVNPHFLFNILQSINGIAQINGDKQVSRLICMLSKFFRGNLERRNVFCELREELEYSANYMELYKDIYPDRLRIRWEVDETLLSVRIPTYILQPIVENSLVHGMEPRVGTCTIRIRVCRENGQLVIYVRDNGEGIPTEKLEKLMAGEQGSRHIGIGNVRDRIQMCYGPDYGLTISSEYHGYTEVRLILPLS